MEASTGQKAVLDALEVRFVQAPDAIRERLELIREEARLRSLLKAAIQTDSIEGFMGNL